MESQDKKSRLGTIVTFPRKEELLKKYIGHSTKCNVISYRLGKSFLSWRIEANNGI